MHRFIVARNFVSGLLVGVFLCFGLIAGLLYAFIERGLTAHIDVGAIARETRGVIEGQAAQIIPGIIQQLKEQLPGQVASDLADQLMTASFTVYGVEFQIPDETLNVVRAQVEEIVAAEVSRNLDQVDVVEAVEVWGRSAEVMISEALSRELRGRRLPVRVHPSLHWPAVPVVFYVQP